MPRSRRTRISVDVLPSERVQHLSLEEVLAIHERLLETFGGPRGVRDLGLLESALFRPRTGYYEDIAEMASALFESLLMNRLAELAVDAGYKELVGQYIPTAKNSQVAALYPGFGFTECERCSSPDDTVPFRLALSDFTPQTTFVAAD